MPKFSKKSTKILRTVHTDLWTLFQVVVKYFDCTVFCGLRTTEEQQKLYAQGRTKPGYIVTYKDGVKNKSKHQSGNAVDVVFYHTEKPHIRWKDNETNHYFAGAVLGIARLLKEQGVISSNIRCGIDWDMDNDLKDQSFFDIVHFEIK